MPRLWRRCCDYARRMTRIVLPLTTTAHEERDGVKGHYVNLLPFLRLIGMLHLQHSDGATLDLRVTSVLLLRTTMEFVVDHVDIAGARHIGGGVIRFLRARHCSHAHAQALRRQEAELERSKARLE